MKDFEIINKNTEEKFTGQFDENSEKYPYVIFNHNGMIGRLNPSGLNSEKLNKILIDNKDKKDLKIECDEYIIIIK